MDTAAYVSTLAPALYKIAQSVMKEKTADAQTREEAERHFKERIETIQASEREFDSIPPEDGNLHELSQYLANELYATAQEAIGLDDASLTTEVFSFFRAQMKALLSSTPDAPLTPQQLGEIRGEIRLVKLKVLWASAKKSAKRQREDEEMVKRQKELEQRRLDENRLQRWMFVFLGLYALIIVLLVVFARQSWASLTAIPILGIPFSALPWSALGSLASMLYRFYKRSEVDNPEREFRWLFARPLVGIIMGAVTYLVVVSGATLIGLASFQTATTQIREELLWLFAFVGGFSDKVFEAIIERVGLMTTRDDKDKLDARALVEAVKLSQSMALAQSPRDASANDNDLRAAAESDRPSLDNLMTEVSPRKDPATT